MKRDHTMTAADSARTADFIAPPTTVEPFTGPATPDRAESAMRVLRDPFAVAQPETPSTMSGRS
jgi:hypothetical protein